MDTCNGTLVCVFLPLHRHTTAAMVRITRTKPPSMMMYWPLLGRTTSVLCNWQETFTISTAFLWQPSNKEIQRNSMHEQKKQYNHLYISKVQNLKQCYIDHYLVGGCSHSAEIDVQQVATDSSGTSHTLLGCAQAHATVTDCFQFDMSDWQTCKAVLC